MGIASGMLVYALIWCVVFFMALPIGGETAEEAGETLEPGMAESAPVRPGNGKRYRTEKAALPGLK